MKSSALEEILRASKKAGASEVVITPRGEVFDVYERLDGLLHERVRLNAESGREMLQNLKRLANLAEDAPMTWQEGIFRTNSRGITISGHARVFPIIEGELARINLEITKKLSLEELGFSAENLAEARSAAWRPHGLILIAGLATSGVSTTIRAFLEARRSSGATLASVPADDPSRAEAIRALARTRPDMIAIPDAIDEASILAAEYAARTSLVCLGLRAGSAREAEVRLRKMGGGKTRPALVLAQRLVRTLCPRCRSSVTLSRGEADRRLPEALLGRLFGKKPRITVFHGRKCRTCHHTGFLGRTALFETLGGTSLADDGIAKVLAGLTAPEEIAHALAPRKRPAYHAKQLEAHVERSSVGH